VKYALFIRVEAVRLDGGWDVGGAVEKWAKELTAPRVNSVAGHSLPSLIRRRSACAAANQHEANRGRRGRRHPVRPKHHAGRGGVRSRRGAPRVRRGHRPGRGGDATRLLVRLTAAVPTSSVWMTAREVVTHRRSRRCPPPEGWAGASGSASPSRSTASARGGGRCRVAAATGADRTTDHLGIVVTARRCPPRQRSLTRGTEGHLGSEFLPLGRGASHI